MENTKRNDEGWQFPVAVFFSETEPKPLQLNHGDIVNLPDSPAPKWDAVANEIMVRSGVPERYQDSVREAVRLGLESEAKKAGGWKKYALKVKPSSTEPILISPEQEELNRLRAMVEELKANPKVEASTDEKDSKSPLAKS